MYLVTGLPEIIRDDRIYNAVLTVTVRATRMCHLIPTSKNESAHDTAQLMLLNIVGHHYGFHQCLEADLFSFHAQQHNQVEPVDEILAQMHLDWTHAHNLVVDLQEDNIQARKSVHRHHAIFYPSDRVLVGLKKHETASLFPWSTLAPHFAGHFKALRAILENAFQLK